MKVIFAGTPAFAVVALKSLLDSEHEIVAVYTQPDRPAGRGLKLTPSPVKQLAQQYNVDIFQPASLKSEEEQAKLKALDADVMVVAAYGLLLPKAVLSIPRLGCINIHPSLLPRWRGAAPIQRTILAGDEKTGVAIMQMDEGLDTGDVLLQRERALNLSETTQSLHDELAVEGADALLDALGLMTKGEIVPSPQDDTDAVYAEKINKQEAELNWDEDLFTLDRKVRGYNPWPVAKANWQGQQIKIWEAMPVEQQHQYQVGTIVAASKDGVDIAVKGGLLRLLKVQLPGGKPLSIQDFYNAQKDKLQTGNLFA